MLYDFWEYPQCCERCKSQDNDDKNYPVSLLDCETKLCEFCYEDMMTKARELTE